MAYQSVNPYDGKILKTFEELSDEQLEAALETAATCFETWRRTTFAERSAVVAKASAIMRAHIDEFALPVTLQCRVAAKRFIVVEELADRFLDKFQTALAALKPGDPMDEATTLGPLSAEAALVQLLGQVDAAVAKGATVVMGGNHGIYNFTVPNAELRYPLPLPPEIPCFHRDRGNLRANASQQRSWR